MEIKEMTTTTTAIGHPLHHHHVGGPGATQTPTTAPKAAAAAAEATGNQIGEQQRQSGRASKHERISLKKLHSLRNQLLCGFKSFTSSNDRPQYQPSSSSGNKPRDELLHVSAATAAAGCSEHDADRPLTTTVDDYQNQNQNQNRSEEFAVSRSASQQCSAPGSKSPSLISLSKHQLQQHQQRTTLSSSEHESSHLIALLATNSPEDTTQSALRTGQQHGCRFKRASFRRLTGHGKKPQQQTDELLEKNMTKLIRQLDQLGKNIETIDSSNLRRKGSMSTTSGRCADSASEMRDVFYLEKSWTDFVRLDADESQEADDEGLLNLKIQQDAIWELLTSEVFYLKRLRVVRAIFLDTLATLQQDSLLREIEPNKLVSNIEEVYRANYDFWSAHLLPMLVKSRLTNRPLEPTSMEGAFVNIRSLFGSYYRYCLEHTACLDYLRDRNKHDQYFKVYLAWCESQKECERLRLMDLLAKPMQRLTKYPLLLKAIQRKTDDARQWDSLKQMVREMEKFVLTVDLRLRERDELDELRSLAELLESRLDPMFGPSSDIYCDEVNRIIGQNYSQWTFQLCEPLFSCPHGCSRRLLFDSSAPASSPVNFSPIRFKDAQVSGAKLDIVLLILTDQLLVCKQISSSTSGGKWYSQQQQQQPNQTNANQEDERRSPIHSLKSSLYRNSRKHFNSSQRHHNRSSRNSSPQTTTTTTSGAGWSKSRSASGNHLVDSLILANDRTRAAAAAAAKQETSDLLNVGDQRPSSLHLSSSSLAGNVAREHFVGSKSADGSRSGDSFSGGAAHLQLSPTGRAHQQRQNANSSPARLKMIRSPYPIDRLVMHELSDGHRIFCCQLNDSQTIATSFILHVGSCGGSAAEQLPAASSSTKPQATADGAVSGDIGVMHHLSPLSGPFSRRPKSASSNRQHQPQVSPARKLINLIHQAQLRYRAEASFHGVDTASLARADLRKRPKITLGAENSDLSATTPRTSSTELLQLNSYCSPMKVAETDLSSDSTSLEAEERKIVLEQQQMTLLKHDRYDELQTCRFDTGGAKTNARQVARQLDCATSSFVSPLLSVSIEDNNPMARQSSATGQLHVPLGISQNSVFEQDGLEIVTLDSLRHRRAPLRSDLSSGEQSSAAIDGGEPCFDRRRGKSWSCSSGHQQRLASISANSDIEYTTASDAGPPTNELNGGRTPSSRQSGDGSSSSRRQANHLRRQNDIVSISHDQHEESWPLQESRSSLRSGEQSSLSVDEPTSSQHTNNNYRYSCSAGESSQYDVESMAANSQSQQQNRYLSLARRLMAQEQSGGSQTTTLDQASITLNDNYDSLESYDAKAANSRAISIELGNMKGRLSLCNTNHTKSSREEANNDRSTASEESPTGRGRVRVEIQQVDNDEPLLPVLNITSADSNQREASLGDHNCTKRGAEFTRSEPSVINHARSEDNLRRRDHQVSRFGCSGTDGVAMLKPHCNAKVSSNSLDGKPSRNTSRQQETEDSACDEPSTATTAGDLHHHHQCTTGSYDSEWTSINYRGNLLELKCIHKLIHRNKADDSQEGACGKVYLGFYEKLDLHLKQQSSSPGASDTILIHPEKLSLSPSKLKQQPSSKSAGRHSPAKSDSSSSTSRRVRSLKLFTNDLIGSLIKATSSCSVHSSSRND